MCFLVRPSTALQRIRRRFPWRWSTQLCLRKWRKEFQLPLPLTRSLTPISDLSFCLITCHSLLLPSRFTTQTLCVFVPVLHGLGQIRARAGSPPLLQLGLTGLQCTPSAFHEFKLRIALQNCRNGVQTAGFGPFQSLHQGLDVHSFVLYNVPFGQQHI